MEKKKNNKNKEYLKFVNQFYGESLNFKEEELEFSKTTRFERK